MSEAYPTPEDIRDAQQAAIAQNQANMESGELDGLEELRAEVAADPVSTEAYLKANQRLAESE